MRRYARKVDTTQAEIVNALRAVGWEVFLIGEPCDALCYRAGIWRTLEIKTANRKGDKYKPRKDQAEQNDFCKRTGTPRVTTPAQAIAALSIDPSPVRPPPYFNPPYDVKVLP